MASWKCPTCMLVNRDSDPACRRCGAASTAGAFNRAGNGAAQPGYGSASQSGGYYGAPNQTAGNYGAPNQAGGNYGSPNAGSHPANQGGGYVTNRNLNSEPAVPAYGLPQDPQPAWGYGQPGPVQPDGYGASHTTGGAQGLPSVWNGSFAPGAAAPAEAGPGVWRDGRILVLHRTAQLPDRCLKCNAPAHGNRIQSTLRWADSFSWLRYIPYLRLLYWIMRATTSSKNADVSLGICSSHHSQHNLLVAITNIASISGLILIVYGFYNEDGIFIGVGFAVALAAIIFRQLSTIVRVSKLDREYIWMKGATPAYLDALPQVPR